MLSTEKHSYWAAALCPCHCSSSEEAAEQLLTSFWATRMQNKYWYWFLLPLKAVTSSYTSIWHKSLFIYVLRHTSHDSHQLSALSLNTLSGNSLQTKPSSLWIQLWSLLSFNSVNSPSYPKKSKKNPKTCWASTGRILMAEDIVLSPNKIL